MFFPSNISFDLLILHILFNKLFVIVKDMSVLILVY